MVNDVSTNASIELNPRDQNVSNRRLLWEILAFFVRSQMK